MGLASLFSNFMGQIHPSKKNFDGDATRTKKDHWIMKSHKNEWSDTALEVIQQRFVFIKLIPIILSSVTNHFCSIHLEKR